MLKENVPNVLKDYSPKEMVNVAQAARKEPGKMPRTTDVHHALKDASPVLEL